MQPLKNGEWTVLLVQNAPVDREYVGNTAGHTSGIPETTTVGFHYVFVSENENGERICLDLQKFLKRVFHADVGEGLESSMATWQQAIGQLKSHEKPITVAACDTEMVDDVLAVIDVLADKETEYQWGHAMSSG